MKYCFVFVAIFLLCVPFCAAQQKNTFEKRNFAWQGDTLPYRLIYPRNYHEGKQYPLIVFLHGSGERGSDNEAQLKQLPGIFNTEEFPCFVLAPQCPKNDVWVSFPFFPQSIKATDTLTRSTRLLLTLIKELCANLNIDTSRLYLTGYSMGGEGTFDIISRVPGMFAAAIPVCAVADTSKAVLLSQNHIWAFHGSADSVNNVIYSRLMIEALQKNGGTPKYTEYPGVGHRCWKKAYAEPDLVPWIFSQRK